MKISCLAMITLYLVFSINFVFSLKSLSSEQSVFSSDLAKRDIIYWTPTAANIIESPSSSPSYQYTSNSPIVTPHTYQSYPSVSASTIYPNTLYYPTTPTFTPTNYNYYTGSGFPFINYPYSAQIPYGSGYYYSPGVSWYYGRKESILEKGPENVLNNTPIKEQKQNIIKSRFQDVTSEIKNLKNEVFGNSKADMSFYKKNKNSYYDSKWLKRAQKIAKILELEELLEFYNTHNNINNVPVTNNQEQNKDTEKLITSTNVNNSTNLNKEVSKKNGAESLPVYHRQDINRVSNDIKGKNVAETNNLRKK